MKWPIYSLLVVGNLIGAGILAIPILAAPIGKFYALFGLIIIASMMLITGNFLVDSLASISGHTKRSNLPTLYKKLLGEKIRWPVIIANLIILYGLLASYLVGLKVLLVEIFPNITAPLSELIFLACYAILIAFMSRGLKFLTKFNSIFMGVLFTSFIIMIILSQDFPNYHIERRVSLKNFLVFLPGIVTAFHFHNIIPNLCEELNWDLKIIKKVFFWGVLIGLIINILWLFAGMTLVNFYGPDEIINFSYPFNVFLGEKLPGAMLTKCAYIFTAVAVLTSFFTNAYGLEGIYDDLIPDSFERYRKFSVMFLSFLPPYLIVFLNPRSFIKLINMVGGIGIVFLFGILPSCIYLQKKSKEKSSKKKLFFGGVFLIAFIGIFIVELREEIINFLGN